MNLEAGKPGETLRKAGNQERASGKQFYSRPIMNPTETSRVLLGQDYQD